jgi:hypothetical protein
MQRNCFLFPWLPVSFGVREHPGSQTPVWEPASRKLCFLHSPNGHG